MRRSHGTRRRSRVPELLCLAVFLLLAAALLIRAHSLRAVRTEERAASQVLRRIPEATPLPSAAPEIFSYFDDLLAQNPQIVGLVGVGNQSMYVCQSEDNLYYANHRFDGSEDPAGMIYMDCRCSILPASDNLILYGHNRRDGSRFGTLKRWEREDVRQKYPTFRFATLYELSDYAPFAVIHTTTNVESPEFFDFAQIDFADETAFDAFVAEARARSLAELDVMPRYGDVLLTLVTCSEHAEEGRLVILCQKIN